MPVFHHKEALIYITRIARRPGRTRQSLTLRLHIRLGDRMHMQGGRRT